MLLIYVIYKIIINSINIVQYMLKQLVRNGFKMDDNPGRQPACPGFYQRFSLFGPAVSPLLFSPPRDSLRYFAVMETRLWATFSGVP